MSVNIGSILFNDTLNIFYLHVNIDYNYILLVHYTFVLMSKLGSGMILS